MTLVGLCARVGLDEGDAARDAFLAVHTEAAGYARFKDFAMWRLDVDEVRWVGGFGRMGAGCRRRRTPGTAEGRFERGVAGEPLGEREQCSNRVHL